MSPRDVPISELFDELGAATLRAVNAELALQRVADLHVSDPREPGRCLSCSTRLPCPTQKALRSVS